MSGPRPVALPPAYAPPVAGPVAPVESTTLEPPVPPCGNVAVPPLPELSDCSAEQPNNAAPSRGRQLSFKTLRDHITGIPPVGTIRTALGIATAICGANIATNMTDQLDVVNHRGGAEQSADGAIRCGSCKPGSPRNHCSLSSAGAASPAVLNIVRSLLFAALAFYGTRGQRAAEILALRHQLGILRRSVPRSVR